MVFHQDDDNSRTRLHRSPETVRSAGQLEDLLSTISDIDDTQRTVYLNVYNQVETLTLAEEQSVIIGRSDAQTGFKPDVDLMRYNARKHGVSREHACIYLRGQSLFLMDMGSNNGTFVNGQKLMAHHPQPLNAGDCVRLGLLEIQIQLP
ncbi:MAG: FHA domain-containing protein [Anaerolineae bacterium]|nr:FHA domain-containing protein [Anaerolineae bacterium]